MIHSMRSRCSLSQIMNPLSCSRATANFVLKRAGVNHPGSTESSVLESMESCELRSLVTSAPVSMNLSAPKDIESSGPGRIQHRA